MVQGGGLVFWHDWPWTTPARALWARWRCNNMCCGGRDDGCERERECRRQHVVHLDKTTCHDPPGRTYSTTSTN